MNRFLADEAATIALARELYVEMPDDLAGWMILLTGELGSGKSTFARAFIKAAGYEGPVPSPTYTLVEPYKLARGTVYHIDLYRVADPEELSFLGWSELDDGVRLIEWPDRAPRLFQDADLALELKYDGNSRNVCIEALSGRGSVLIEKIN